MLYCNIIDVSPVGALLLPVLKTFPVKPTLDTNDLYCYEAKDLEFHRIQYTDINTLQMNMYTSYGAIPQFQNPKGKVQLTLAIRPRRGSTLLRNLQVVRLRKVDLLSFFGIFSDAQR